ncbi:MAG TPA: ASCH domain-containing protein [Armatimonadota bacterium]|nr:ASCH domain-containing protein [Armatimonadota bacterium]
MRNISFSLTVEQFLAGTKTVTRRLGWAFLRPDDMLMACEKCQGLKKGEKIRRLGQIEVVDVRREALDCIIEYPDDCRKEGFPQFSPEAFVTMFCREMRCTSGTPVTRIEFKRIHYPVR